MIDPELLEILACPESLQPLREADAALLAKVNKRIAAGALRTVGGETVSETLVAGLVRQDDKRLYPIRDEIPVLLIEEGIVLESADLA